MAEAAVALSVALSFAMYEGLGLLSGGMVSPGYLALFLEQPLRVLSTLLQSVIVCLFIRWLSGRVLLYNRRRFMLAILLSLALGWAADRFVLRLLPLAQDLRAIGHIVPGLIANDMFRQGVPRTLLSVLLGAALVRLALLAVGLL